MKLLFSLTLCLFLLPLPCSASPLEDLDQAKNAIRKQDFTAATRLLEPLTRDEQVRRDIRAQAFFYLSYCVPEDRQLEYAENALRLSDRTSEFHYRCAEILYRQKQTRQALHRLRDALSLIASDSPGRTPYLKLAARCYWEQQDKANAAMNISAAIALSPRDPELYLLEGRIHSADGTVHDGVAVESFKKALSLGLPPKDRVQCYLFLGKLYEYSRELDEAALFYARAHEETEDNLLKKKLKRKLQSFTMLKKWNS